MKPRELYRVRRSELIRELLKWLEWYEENGTQSLQDFLGIPATGWLYYLREGVHGQSDDRLRIILNHILTTSSNDT